MLRLPALHPWELAVLAAIGTQLLKFVLYGAANRRLSLRVLVTTSGLPSLYAVTFSCLTAAVAVESGWSSSLATVALAFTGVILHDLVRLKGSVDRGGRATALVVRSLEHDHRLAWEERLLPLLGDRRHRPLHIVVGVVLGLLLGLGWHPR